MKLSIPLKDIILAPGKRFDPSLFSERDVIERVKKIYGVITEVMDIAIKDGMVEIEFRDATPEKFKSAMKSLKKGVKEAGQGRFPNALKLFQEALGGCPRIHQTCHFERSEKSYCVENTPVLDFSLRSK